MTVNRLLRASLVVGVLGCGGANARQHLTTWVTHGQYVEAVESTRTGGRDPALELELAEVVLEYEASSPDSERKRRAFSELQLAGSRARDVLERLSHSAQPIVRARALSARVGLGDSDARATLRELADDPDPELSALGVSALDPERDRSQLLAALGGPRAARRLSAVRVLARAPALPELRPPLEAALRLDPDPGVRASAAAVLSKYGLPAAAALERALRDGDPSVRISAIAALGRAGGPAELDRLGRELGNAASTETLAAASAVLWAHARGLATTEQRHARSQRTLARERPLSSNAKRSDDVGAAEDAESADVDRAIALFERALSASESELRAQAAVSCRNLPPAIASSRGERPCSPQLLASRLSIEPRPEVRLLLAVALGVSHAAARRALTDLARDPSTTTAVEAAAELAAHGDEGARRVVQAALADARAGVKVTALRALSRLPDPPELAPSLADPSSAVRVAAAVGVLRLH